MELFLMYLYGFCLLFRNIYFKKCVVSISSISSNTKRFKRVNKIAGVLRKFQNGLSRNSLKTIYQPFVRPHPVMILYMTKERTLPFIGN